MSPLHTIGLVLAWLYGGLCLFILAMGFYRCYLAKQLNPVLIAIGAPVLGLAIVADVVSNATLAWLIFLEPPHEWTVTRRLQRYLHQPDQPPWRRAAADWTCTWLLNPFDPRGRHC